MADLVDTQETVPRPICCSLAGDYIRICDPDTLYGPDKHGWTLTLYRTNDPVRENVRFCPWCGKELPAV